MPYKGTSSLDEGNAAKLNRQHFTRLLQKEKALLR